MEAGGVPSSCFQRGSVLVTNPVLCRSAQLNRKFSLSFLSLFLCLSACVTGALVGVADRVDHRTDRSRRQRAAAHAVHLAPYVGPLPGLPAGATITLRGVRSVLVWIESGLGIRRWVARLRLQVGEGELRSVVR